MTLTLQVPDVESATDPNTLHPVVLGALDSTEILREDTWETYQSLEEGDTWLASGCVVRYGDNLYSILDAVWELDLTAPTWTAEEVAEVPMQFRAPGQCALLEVDGVAGKIK